MNSFINESNHVDRAEFKSMIFALDREFGFMDSAKSNDITSQQDFIRLHDLTEEFYRNVHSDIFDDFVPIYHSIWKLRVRDSIGIRNMHQDGGIHYFGKKGYQSRMVTLWTNMHKDKFEALGDKELGIYVVENSGKQNNLLYETLSQSDSHFFQKGDDKLYDIRQISNQGVSFPLKNLDRREFSYSKGTTIRFNSHLLHGTIPSEITDSDTLDNFRVSLTSVWVHREDLNADILEMNKRELVDIFCQGYNDEQRSRILSHLNHVCEKELYRIENISRLISHFLNKNKKNYEQ
ncbi:hypothetical protein [Aureibacter tunicatorum]|uniref:Uncharacterized protein n=1 Tax=Aureibacter tunicatorum TaxID=866807 RepID=A0AAE4BRN1_9BACT|nr:hypothetical protein [Aureibacter tunicatorum]MDR6237372.1 hypothetical protein [Aureibacter tunicatorum]BDD06363.1 hypothetical protein AUTU_38460 [Aureibacter tunicatorum]